MAITQLKELDPSGTHELAAPVEGSDSLHSLIAKLSEIRCSLINQESEFRKQITAAHPTYQKSARNLIHYLALRRHDIGDANNFWNFTETEMSRAKMRCNSQFLRSMNSFVDKTGSMKTPVMLLLTDDNELEELVANALSEIGGISYLARDAGDALETICGLDDLDLAIIDFEYGPHGMTLLSTISTLREDLPVIVISRDDGEHVEALAYANGAAACLSKQAVATQLKNTIFHVCYSTQAKVLA